MSTHPTTLRHRVRRAAALAAGVATLGGFAVASIPATANATVPAAAAPNATIMVVHNKTWGSLLALSNGDTVYRFVLDTKNHSACTGKCAKIWPPVDLAKNQKAPIGKGVKGLGTINRGGGVKQVTYEGIPLYRFVGDTAAFQVKGNIKDSFGQWYSVNPAKPTSIPHAAKAARSPKPPTTSASSGSGGAAF
jgi:predicted lipoprotein with Yx(FWY)xxD motif